MTDLDRDRRPGTLQAFSDFIKLQQHFDIIHKLGPGVEPQDIPAHLRHYETMRAQLMLSDKVPFIYSRGQHQVLDGFEMSRHIGLPWRSGAGTAANATDVQGAYETQFSIWGAVLGGANLIYHAAGWLEGGLSISYEKFITDIEVLQMIAETMTPISCSRQDIAFDAIASVEPGGHFFGAEHTLARYSTQFYEPLISDWSNYGQWHEAGSRTTAQTANTMWKRTLEEFEPPATDPGQIEELQEIR